MEDKSRGYVTVIGSIHMDFTAVMEKFPRIGETVISYDFKMSPGGKGANQAVAAARLGAKTFMVGKVGDDFIGKILLENLAKNNVLTDYVSIDNTVYTGLALIFVDREGRNMIAVVPGTDCRVSIDDVDKARDALGRSKVVLLQLEIPTETVLYAAKQGKRFGCKVILNPAPYTELPEEIFRYIDVITPNIIEAESLTGEEIRNNNDCIRAGRKLLRKGVKAVVITLGAEGAMIITEGYERHVGTFAVNVVDTTGAGDAFNGALAVALAEGKSLEEAVLFGNAAASIKVTRLGAQEGLPTREEVERFLKKRGVRL